MKVFNPRSPLLCPKLILSILKNMTAPFELEQAAQHSTINHHANGMDYLCLNRDPDGETLKLYLIEEPHKAKERSGYLVHPHTHRYPFSTIVLSGMVDHYRFKAKPCEATDKDAWSKFPFFAETRELGKPDHVTLRTVSIEEHHEGGVYFVNPDEIHTLSMISVRPLLLGLTQYPDVDRVSNIYIPKGKQIDFSDSRRPTVEEVIRIRDRCIQLIEESDA